MYIDIYVKYQLFLSDFNETLMFWIGLKKHLSNFMKPRPLGAEFFCADRQTDVTKLTVASRNFANAPKTTRRSQSSFPYF